MTCIAAHIDGNVVVMISDSASTTDNVLTVRSGVPKVWHGVGQANGLLIGFCGNFAEGQWIRHGFVWPSRPSTMPFDAWLSAIVQPALSKCMEKRFGKDTIVSWTLIVATATSGANTGPRIFVLSQCGDVEESVNNFNAIGCGAEVAKGALASLEDSNLRPHERLQKALGIVERFDCTVRGPMHLDYIMAKF